MLYDLDNIFDDYVAGRHVSEDIPDELNDPPKMVHRSTDNPKDLKEEICEMIDEINDFLARIDDADYKRLFIDD